MRYVYTVLNIDQDDIAFALCLIIGSLLTGGLSVRRVICWNKATYLLALVADLVYHVFAGFCLGRGSLLDQSSLKQLQKRGYTPHTSI
jgi:hypothetical protein